MLQAVTFVYSGVHHAIAMSCSMKPESSAYICKIRNMSKFSNSKGLRTSKTNSSVLQVKASCAYQPQKFI